MSELPRPIPQRIGDAERDRAVECLREHLAQGRLDQSEFDDRMERALAARTQGDIDPLFTDLPEPKPGRPTSQTPFADPSASVDQTQPGYRAPTGQIQPVAARPAEAVGVPADAAVPARQSSTALGVITGVAWPVTLLALFATDWRFWWLIFIPIAISAVFGSVRHQHR